LRQGGFNDEKETEYTPFKSKKHFPKLEEITCENIDGSKLIQKLILRSRNLKTVRLLGDAGQDAFFIKPPCQYHKLQHLEVCDPGFTGSEFTWTEHMITWLKHLPNLEAFILFGAHPSANWRRRQHSLELLLQAFLPFPASGNGEEVEPEDLCPKLLRLRLSGCTIRIPSIIRKIMERRALLDIGSENNNSPPVLSGTQEGSVNQTRRSLTISIDGELFTNSSEDRPALRLEGADWNAFQEVFDDAVAKTDNILKDFDMNEFIGTISCSERMRKLQAVYPDSDDALRQARLSRPGSRNIFGGSSDSD